MYFNIGYWAFSHCFLKPDNWNYTIFVEMSTSLTTKLLYMAIWLPYEYMNNENEWIVAINSLQLVMVTSK